MKEWVQSLWKNKQKTKNKEKKTKRSEWLKELTTYRLKDKKEYEDEVWEELERYNENIQQVMNQILEEELEEEEVKNMILTIKEQYHEIQNKINGKDQNWKTSQETIREIVNRLVSYFETTNFYPPEYVFETNKIEGYILEIEEASQRNPFLDVKILIKEAQTLEEKVNRFRHLHQKTSLVLEEIESKYSKGHPKFIEIQEMKQQLYIYLHQGELKKAEKWLRKLKDKS